VKPHIDEGLNAEAAADVAYKDLKRASERHDRQYKPH
jgi:hypothetical protein